MRRTKGGRTTARQCTKESFKALVREWAVRLKVTPAQIRVQKMRSKWASCSPGKWTTFSEDLLRQSAGFQNCAIVHELLHLRIPNHGKLFKSLMRIYMPDCREWEDCMERTLVKAAIYRRHGVNFNKG